MGPALLGFLGPERLFAPLLSSSAVVISLEPAPAPAFHVVGYVREHDRGLGAPDSDGAAG